MDDKESERPPKPNSMTRSKAGGNNILDNEVDTTSSAGSMSGINVLRPFTIPMEDVDPFNIGYLSSKEFTHLLSIYGLDRISITMDDLRSRSMTPMRSLRSLRGITTVHLQK
jgi:hypothetical protein